MTKSQTPPFEIHGIDHVVFLVDDMDKALGFYRDLLGCKVGYEYPNLGMVQVWAGVSLIVLWDITHPGAKRAIPPISNGRNVDHVCLALGRFDPDEMKKFLEASEIQIVEEANHGGARGVGYSIYVNDPFGNKLELKGPPEYPDGR